MARISQQTIEQVTAIADIVDVVGEHIVLKKKGREFVGICPFHDDTNPSLTVNDSKNLFFCSRVF